MASSQDQSALAKGVIAYMGTVSELTTSRIDTKIARSPELKNFLIHLSERAPSIMNKLLKSVSGKCEAALRTEKQSHASRKRPEPPNGNESSAKRLKIGDSPCSKITLPPTPTSDKDKGSRNEVSKDQGPVIKHGEQKLSDITFTSVCKSQEGTIDNVSNAPQCDSESLTGSQSSRVTLPRTPSSEKDEHSRHENSEEEASTGKPEKKSFSNVASTPVNPADISSHCDIISGLIIGSQSSEMELPQLSAPENEIRIRAESTEKDIPHTKPDAICVHQKGDIVNLPTAYAIESGLSNGSSFIENHVRESLFALAPTRSNINVHAEVTKVWKVISLLDFFRTKRELYQYLENREKMPGEKLHTRTNWETTDPSKILETLENVKRSTVDNKIHRAYGQTMLFSSVNAQVADGYRSTVTGHRCNHTALLEELARRKAGPVSEMEIGQTIASYFYEYYAGQRWLAVINWFGGPGIVLVFVIAGIGTTYMKQWTDFQKSCVQHIAGLLHGIRGLVETLGHDALKHYCYHGCLSKPCVERVKLAEFVKSDVEGYEDVDEEADDEEHGDATGESDNGDEGPQDENGGSRDADEESEGDSDQENLFVLQGPLKDVKNAEDYTN